MSTEHHQAFLDEAADRVRRGPSTPPPPEFTLSQLRELRKLSLELGFMDDVAHWDRLIREATTTEDRSEP